MKTEKREEQKQAKREERGSAIEKRHEQKQKVKENGRLSF